MLHLLSNAHRHPPVNPAEHVDRIISFSGIHPGIQVLLNTTRGPALGSLIDAIGRIDAIARIRYDFHRLDDGPHCAYIDCEDVIPDEHCVERRELGRFCPPTLHDLAESHLRCLYDIFGRST